MALTKISRSLLDTGISDSSDATAITITSAEKVLLGTSTASSSTHARLVLGGGTENYIQFSSTNNVGASIGVTSAGNMPFYTFTGAVGSESFSERMRITSAGKIGVGTTSPNGVLDVQSTSSTAIKILQDSTSAAFTIQQNGSNAFNHVGEFFCPNLTSGENTLLAVGKAGSTKQTGYIGYYWSSTASNDNFIHLSHWGSDNLFRVYGNGQISSNSIYSDRDKKENIVEVSGTSLDKIIQVPIKSFRMKQIGEFTTEVRPQKTGFIAQEVQPYLPDVVSGTDGQGDMGIDTVGIIAHLVRAIKEQQDIIDDLKSRIETLEG